MKRLLNPHDLGLQVRAERKARNRTQSWVAERVGCRRQTIADLESGKNVSTIVLLGALSALGKALVIVDARVDLDQLTEIFSDED